MKKLILLLIVLPFHHLFAQDTCATALEVAPGGIYTVDEVNGEPEPFVCTDATNDQTSGEWYKYTNTNSLYEYVKVTTNLPANLNRDTRVMVYSGDCNSLACVTGNDDINRFTYTSEVYFTVPPSESFIFVFDNVRTTRGFQFEVTSFPVTCETQVPYYEDFDKDYFFKGCYKREDADDNGFTWISKQDEDFNYDGDPETYALNVNGNSSEPVEEDYLFTPAFTLEGGETYHLKIHYNAFFQQNPSTQNLYVYATNAPNSSAPRLANIISLIHVSGSDFLQELVQTNRVAEGEFTPESSGEYYFAFYVNTDVAGFNGEVFIFDYSLTKVCTQPPTTTNQAAQNVIALSNSVGISTLTKKQDENWLNNIGYGNLVLESHNKGLVIPRTRVGLVTNPEEGMLVWDTDHTCLMIYRNEIWKCLDQTCNE